MPTHIHDDEAATRDAEVAALYPRTVRRHLRATLPARVVLRHVEDENDERELKVLGESYLVAVIVDGSVKFYAGQNPVWLAASLGASSISEVGTAHQGELLMSPGVWPLLRLSWTDADGTSLDLDFEVYDFDGSKLHQAPSIDDVVGWWREELHTV